MLPPLAVLIIRQYSHFLFTSLSSYGLPDDLPQLEQRVRMEIRHADAYYWFGMAEHGNMVAFKKGQAHLDRAQALLATAEAEVLSDRVVIISYGKIIADGTPSQLILQHGVKTTLIVEEGGKQAHCILQKKFSDLKLENGDVHVPINSKSDLPEAVMALNGNKANYSELIVRRPDLEDVFLNLTGKKIVDGELS